MDSVQKTLYWRDRLAAAEKVSREGNKQKAELLYRQSLEMAKDLTEQERITSIVQLADFYNASKEYAKAEPFYRLACEIYDKRFGQKNIIGAMCLRSLGEVLEALGRSSEAAAVKSRSLDILSTLL